MKQISKRKNSSEPQKKADQKRGDRIEHPRPVETLFQYGSEQWLNDRLVVPNVERAPENLGNDRSQCCEEQAVMLARRSSGQPYLANFHFIRKFQIPISKSQTTRARCARLNFVGDNIDVI